MRVTKLIREYVEKTIATKLPYGEPTQVNHEACAKMETLRQQVNAQVVEYATKLCEEANQELPEGFTISLYGHTPITKTNYGAPLQKAAIEHEKEIRDRRAEAIESILVELELGATKADLERLIAEAIGE
jgi:hypothetical protein